MAEIHSHIIVTFHTFESHFLVIPITSDDSETVTFYDNDGDDSVINAKQAPANSTSSTDVQGLNEWNYTRAAAPTDKYLTSLQQLAQHLTSLAQLAQH